MKKLSTKIVAILIVIFIFISSIARMTVYFLRYSPTAEIMNSSVFILAMMAMGFSSLTLFAFAINSIIVKRIYKINKIVKEIGSGKFDVKIDVDGHDEISSLMQNINLMSSELQANEYLSKEFAKNVSHEFKTPLSSIKGYSELIESGTLSKEEIIEYSRIIINEIDRLAILSKNMMQISLLDSVNIIKRDEQFSIDEQIRNVLQLTQLDWESKNINFDLDLEEINYVGNKELTFLIWQNLISNAIKFSKEFDTIQISLSKKDQVYFEIEDHGIGISEEDQKKIFNQFFVANTSRNKCGSGLGLSITKKIIEKLGGTITFTSQVNNGTTFFVSLKCNLGLTNK
ncbi:MAG: HAMP domain-containing histidine kinase [Firmicutes bacterium]|nr:HAMP domain-containing histidine kinase [Bacillota bacterium]